MSESAFWPWVVFFLLGAYHGVNPGMGWLFAVALGMQERSGGAVWRALLPITAGHGLSIGAVVGLAWIVQTTLPIRWLKLVVALLLFGLGLHRLARTWHPRFGGMRVGFVDLAIWSFLMASAHGAGLMLLPFLYRLPLSPPAHSFQHQPAVGGWTGLLAVLVHTAGYLIVTGLAAWLVYEKFGLSLLRRAWFNLDLVWSAALIATGAFILLL